MMPNVQDCEPNYHLKICLKTISNELSFTLLRWHYNITYNLFTFIDINKNTFSYIRIHYLICDYHA